MGSARLVFGFGGHGLRKFVMEEWLAELDGGWQATPSITKFLTMDNVVNEEKEEENSRLSSKAQWEIFTNILSS